ncbi:MAG: DcaP family trimeric outer membrane transporter [Gammaproteobacteria bacterium]
MFTPKTEPGRAARRGLHEMTKSVSLLRPAALIVTALLSAPTHGQAADSPLPAGNDGSVPADEEIPADLNALVGLLKQQQSELETQRKLLESQAQDLRKLRDEVDALRSPVVTAQPEADAKLKTEQAEAEGAAPESDGKPAASDTIADAGRAAAPEPDDGEAPAQEDVAPEAVAEEKEQEETTEEVAIARKDDPVRLILDDLPGAWRLPGTDSALAIGGYVKTTGIYNHDALATSDRFIVGLIPTDSAENLEAESAITTIQSRLSFDLRQATDYGLMRGFVEGDFASGGNAETFRLRHSFWQWRRVLAGKTWSAFVDTAATPEEVDFEGLNGRINVRQSLVRVAPKFGESLELQLSFEDPDPRVENGDGVSRWPDVVAATRYNVGERLHLKAAGLVRQVRARPASGEGSVERKIGFGLSLSGSFETPLFDPRDRLLFQLNGGRGIGRYVNDLSSVGDFDGIIDERTGAMKLRGIYAGYASWQHWWSDALRSNLTLGMVYVDNPGFAPGDAYKYTLRSSANVIWTPSRRLDLGAEFLWGERVNEDDGNGDAAQIQAFSRLRF